LLERLLTPVGAWEMRDTVRRLLRQPGHFVLMALSLALGATSVAIIGSAAYALLFKALPYRDADRLAIVWDANTRLSVDRMGLTSARYLSLLEDADVFSQAAAIANCVPLTMSDGVRLRELTCGMATPNLLDVLGVAPALGTGFAAGAIASVPAAPSALLSHSAWRDHFGADPSVVGRVVSLSAQRLAIVGVLPPGVEVLNSGTDVWVPLHVGPSARTFPARYLTVIARLKPGWTLGSVQSRLDVLDAGTDATRPAADRGWRHTVTRLDAEVTHTTRPAVWAATVGALLVVILVGTNGLFLNTARRLTRARELAVRQALGATARDLARLAWYDAAVVLLLAAGMGAVGFVFAGGLLAALVMALPDAPRVAELASSSSAAVPVAYVAAFLVAAGAYVAISRPWRAGAGPSIHPGADAHAPPPGDRSWRLAVIVEAAIAVTFVALTALLASSVDALVRTPVGFDPSHLLTGRLLLSNLDFDRPRRVLFVNELLARVRAMPGVSSAAVVRGLPMTSPFGHRAEWFGTALENSWETLLCRRTEDAGGHDVIPSTLRLVTPDYLRTMRVTLLSGRPLDDADYAAKTPVAVVSASLARHLWGKSSAGGRITCVGTTTDTLDVVGIVGDVRDRRPGADARPTVYVMYPREALAAVGLVVRATTPPASLATALSATVRSIDARALLTDVRPMTDRIDSALARPTILSRVFAVFALLATGLALVGAYGVSRADVSRRRHELAIRLALGASTALVCRGLLRRACWLAGAGLAIGGWVALLMSRLIASLLGGLEPMRAAAVLLVAAGLVALVVIAAHLPALRQVLRLDPSDVLRGDAG
jgi:putative ABC transport system permease protein